MSLFETLLDIKTGEKNLLIKAVYIENTSIWNKWNYYIYYHDLIKNTIYINDLDWNQNRASAINIIERVVSKIYKQEINNYGDVITKILQYTEPKVILFYRQEYTKLIIMDRVYLKAIKNKKKAIIWFKDPKWSNNNQKIKSNILKD